MTARSVPEWIGRRFGMLVVLAEAGRRRRARLWRCVCDCGQETFATTGSLNAGSKVSCGCTPSGRKNRRHGLSHSPEYRAWDNARSRCRNPRNIKYQHYGARGISMCDRWLNSFDAFIADMGMKPGPGYSLDRVDNNGNYEPGNCRWATVSQQNNNRSFNRFLTVGGKRVTVAEASRMTGVPHGTIISRLDAGKSDDEATVHA